MSSAKWRLFCFGLSELIIYDLVYWKYICIKRREGRIDQDDDSGANGGMSYHFQ